MIARAMNAPGPDVLLEIYASMLRVRLFEERARELFQNGRIPGFLHTSVGQEAVAVGVAAALRPDDYVLSTHRGHAADRARARALARRDRRRPRGPRRDHRAPLRLLSAEP